MGEKYDANDNTETIVDSRQKPMVSREKKVLLPVSLKL